MWCRRQAAAAMLPFLLVGWLTGESSEALTTFGKSNTQPPKEVVPTAPPARACGKPSDCAGISSSSCVRTHYDSTTRCLCGDNSPPVNGQCEAQTKSLYHICSNSDECNDGLVCATPNITGTPPPHLRMYLTTERHTICQCDAENGFREHEHSCSDAIIKLNILRRHNRATLMDPKHTAVEGDERADSPARQESEATPIGPELIVPIVHMATRQYVSKTQKQWESKNDADILKTSVFAVIIVSCIRKILVY
ncbi:uncharacterized protein LOC135085302 [Ostrinia nubilalis]|uniref:uncharacterized protein LOC135085302 n=1 Tax=Ostrinia nubilalis TaxID=29057 RepID=UPI0030822A13